MKSLKKMAVWGAFLAYSLNSQASMAQTVVDLINGDPELSILAELIETADLGTTLSERFDQTVIGAPDTGYTVLAPVDAAFLALPPEVLEGLRRDPRGLPQLLAQHVSTSGGTFAQIQEALARTARVSGIGFPIYYTLGEFPLRTELNGSNLVIEDSRVIQADIIGSNGTVHKVDKVIVPTNFAIATKNTVDTLDSKGKFSTLVRLLRRSGLDQVLNRDASSLSSGYYTVLAPTDAAFARLGARELARLEQDPAALQEILKLHVSTQVFETPRFFAWQVTPRGSMFFETISGVKLKATAAVGLNSEFIRIQDAIGSEQFFSTNSSIYAIDRVLKPDVGIRN